MKSKNSVLNTLTLFLATSVLFFSLKSQALANSCDRVFTKYSSSQSEAGIEGNREGNPPSITLEAIQKLPQPIKKVMIKVLDQFIKNGFDLPIKMDSEFSNAARMLLSIDSTAQIRLGAWIQNFLRSSFGVSAPAKHSEAETSLLQIFGAKSKLALSSHEKVLPANDSLEQFFSKLQLRNLVSKTGDENPQDTAQYQETVLKIDADQKGTQRIRRKKSFAVKNLGHRMSQSSIFALKELGIIAADIQRPDLVFQILQIQLDSKNFDAALEVALAVETSPSIQVTHQVTHQATPSNSWLYEISLLALAEFAFGTDFKAGAYSMNKNVALLDNALTGLALVRGKLEGQAKNILAQFAEALHSTQDKDWQEFDAIEFASLRALLLTSPVLFAAGHPTSNLISSQSLVVQSLNPRIAETAKQYYKSLQVRSGDTGYRPELLRLIQVTGSSELARNALTEFQADLSVYGNVMGGLEIFSALGETQSGYEFIAKEIILKEKDPIPLTSLYEMLRALHPYDERNIAEIAKEFLAWLKLQKDISPRAASTVREILKLSKILQQIATDNGPIPRRNPWSRDTSSSYDDIILFAKSSSSKKIIKSAPEVGINFAALSDGSNIDILRHMVLHTEELPSAVQYFLAQEKPEVALKILLNVAGLLP